VDTCELDVNIYSSEHILEGSEKREPVCVKLAIVDRRVGELAPVLPLIFTAKHRIE
jgi:hypothetical protein